MLKELLELEGLSPLVLTAPSTAADTAVGRVHEVLSPLTIRYLKRFVVGKPWLSHLTLALLIMAARGCQQSSVYGAASLVHKRMCGFARARYTKFFSMKSFDEKLNECFRLYLSGLVMARDSDATRNSFYQRYQSIAASSYEWLMALPASLRDTYRPLIFRGVEETEIRHLLRSNEIYQIQQQTRKAEVDAVMPSFVMIRQQAHLRFNFLSRLADAFKSVVDRIDDVPDDGYVSFQYIDNGFCFDFRVWQCSAFRQKFSLDAWLGKRANAVLPNYFAELVRVYRESDSAEIPIDERLWFADLLRHGINRGSLTDSEKKWLKSFGYPISGFDVQPGLITWRSTIFMREVQKRVQGLLLPITELYHAAAFGLLAIDLFTTTGVRMNEAMQISLDPDCLVRLEIARPPESEQVHSTIRYSLRLIPKGERKDERFDNFIGVETKRILVRVAKMLEQHYGLDENEALPVVPFDPLHRRAHRFGPSRYIFQLHHKHLRQGSISACIRFLVHGLDFRTSEGKIVSIRAHLLRHAFATHAVQVEKIPVDIVGKWLHQKSIAVTEYYSAPTATMVADTADYYLSTIASHINVEKEVSRSPENLRKLYEDSISRTGTLAHVVGGSCGSHGLCQSQLACIGCSAKIPDPAMRSQVTHQREWATKELVFYRKEGLMPAARRIEQLIMHADEELREMDSIEAYRADETKTAIVKEHL